MTIQQLQRITLERQGLLHTSPFGKGKVAVAHAIEHLGYLQIDTLSIVERAHHHTLWTRIPDYKTAYLDELVKEQKVFEYWFHAASYLPMSDFRFALPQMSAVRENKSHYYNAAPRMMQYIMEMIQAEGPKKARDFEHATKKSGSWWDWKPAKIALERLFLQGDLMISGRNGMEKTYDIAERVLPENIDRTLPDPLEWASYLVKTYLRAYGFTTIKQITHLKKGAALRKNVNIVLQEMLEEGLIQKEVIEGLPPVFIQTELANKTIRKNNSAVRLLSPFDNSIIHRDRIRQLFNFDFRIECYTPKEKRQYGYFCLPILFGDLFIGRVDCKAHRKEQQFELISLYIENENIAIELWAKPFVELMKQFAKFNGCTSVKLVNVSPSKFTNILKGMIQAYEE